MAKATTSSVSKDEGPAMTPAQLASKKAELDREIDAEYGKDPSESETVEPAEELSPEKEPEQELEKAEDEESSETKSPEEAVTEEEESEPQPEDPKEKRYREQLAGERKANAELQARLQALEAKTVSPQQQKEMTEEEKQFLAEKQMLKEKYNLVEKQEVVELLDARLKPIQKKREDAILQGLYSKFPDVSPDKDPTKEKWDKVMVWVNRILPASSSDPLDDIEERFEWGYEKAFGKKTNYAPARQTSYTSVGGGSSAAKSRTTVGNDKYANLAPAVRARKMAFDQTLDEEWAREDAKKK